MNYEPWNFNAGLTRHSTRIAFRGHCEYACALEIFKPMARRWAVLCDWLVWSTVCGGIGFALGRLA